MNDYSVFSPGAGFLYDLRIASAPEVINSGELIILICTYD